MKKILTDADGVLLNWEIAFHSWMQKYGHQQNTNDNYNIHIMYPHLAPDEAKRLVKEFNNSAWMCCLPVFRDAKIGVAKLHEAGYKFDVITSLSADPYAKRLRQLNLDMHFDNATWDQLTCLDTGADKDEALKQYADTGYWWIEDKPENCDAGLKFGLRPILIDHLHNQWYDNPDVIRVNNWAELCEVVLGE
jgi:FMN phosphatase YigB (HAD superfamily)